MGILLRILQGIGWLRIEPDLRALIPPAAFGMASVAISIALDRSILEVQQRINNANRELRQREASERERLETAVVDRTRELHTALALVEKASADKSGFLSMMAHEIRSPLHAVIWHLQLLQREQHSGHEESIRAIERATTRLLQMVSQTLSFSKGEQAAIRLDPGPVVLAPFLGDIAAAVGAVAGDATQRTRIILGRELPAVIEVDEQYLRQVLENLATNACKYAPEGDVQIRVEALRSDPDSAAGPLHRLRFSVSDRGPGIAEADQMLIFEPFSRISTRDRMHGVGLGLPICRQLLQAMGSELNLDSDRGRGACFWFDLEVPALAEDSGSTEDAEDVDARASGRRTRFWYLRWKCWSWVRCWALSAGLAPLRRPIPHTLLSSTRLWRTALPLTLRHLHGSSRVPAVDGISEALTWLPGGHYREQIRRPRSRLSRCIPAYSGRQHRAPGRVHDDAQHSRNRMDVPLPTGLPIQNRAIAISYRTPITYFNDPDLWQCTRRRPVRRQEQQRGTFISERSQVCRRSQIAIPARRYQPPLVPLTVNPVATCT